MADRVMGLVDAERIGAKLGRLYDTDEQIRAVLPRPQVSEALSRPGMRLSQMVATVMGGYADRPALAERAYKLAPDSDGRTTRQFLDHFDTLTFAELWRRVGAVASAWRHGPAGVAAGDFICTIGSACIDYTVLDLACLRLGAVSVPLPATGTVAMLATMIDEIQPKILCSGIETLDISVEAMLAAQWAPVQLLVFDYLPDIDAQRDVFDHATARLGKQGPAVESLSSLLEAGTTLPAVPPYVAEDDDNPLVSLLYTSGSTGTPKAAMYTERMSSIVWRDPSPAPAIVLNYMPMSHFYGRAFLYTTMAAGGTNYFVAKHDMSTLFEDFALVRPTALNLVPRVCEMIAHRYHGELDRRVAQGMELDAAVQGIKEQVRQELLGGRYLYASCASAPLSAEMTALMEDLLDVPLIISYGATEVIGVMIDGVVSRPPVIDYKLVDVPELGYFGTDRPYPRGELLVKTEHVMPGYYKRPEVTAQMFDADGYYRTGDIMAETAPDRLAYVDRRNNVLKLSQGEFVTVSQLEAAYIDHPLIRQIYVYGNSEQSFLLAVVVPDTEALTGSDAEVKAQVAEALAHTARKAGLQPYEIPRDFLVETEPFTEDNKLLTTSSKLARPALKERYGPALEQMYADMAAGHINELRDLRSRRDERSVLDTVCRAVHATLGLAPGELDPRTQFLDLGGDSLSALTLSTLLEEIFDIEVPVAVVIGPTTDLESLAGYITDHRTGTHAEMPRASSVHGPNTDCVHAADLTLDKFIDADVLAAAKTLAPPTADVATVLVTGANGFLGRFQCLEWLQRLTESNGTVICVARGSTNEEARQRITDAFCGDDELSATFAELSDGHFEVLAGDLSKPRIGLSRRDWDRLTEIVDTVVHPAALVNHVLPYGQLFGPNVFGTAEILRLAMTTRLKPLTYVSTLAAAIAPDGSLLDEDVDIREVSPSLDLNDNYANGYALSKWAGEVLCREAHAWCGLPVSVFRCNMILTHSRYARQLNVPDIFTRLLLSILLTGIAPKSFYLDGAPKPHYDGLPVDFIAKATTQIGAHATSGFHTYNVVNPHDDGISLDTFVDWLDQEGYKIQRITNYNDWVARLETAMRALPEDLRQHTLINLMSAFQAPGVPVRGSAFSADRFRRAVQAPYDGETGEIPHLSSELIAKYTADLIELGLLSC